MKMKCKTVNKFQINQLLVSMWLRSIGWVIHKSFKYENYYILEQINLLCEGN